MQRKNIVSGLWKFRSSITHEQLEELARQWLEEDPAYTQLFIRKCSTDQNGIGFMYQLPEGDEKELYREYFEKTSDTLKRAFGNDLAGWDISCPTWILK